MKNTVAARKTVAEYRRACWDSLAPEMTLTVRDDLKDSRRKAGTHKTVMFKDADTMRVYLKGRNGTRTTTSSLRGVIDSYTWDGKPERPHSDPPAPAPAGDGAWRLAYDGLRGEVDALRERISKLETDLGVKA